LGVQLVQPRLPKFQAAVFLCRVHQADQERLAIPDQLDLLDLVGSRARQEPLVRPVFRDTKDLLEQLVTRDFQACQDLTESLDPRDHLEATVCL